MRRPTPELNESLVEGLSPRRRAVLELIAKGLTNDEIASALMISPTTVRTHITAVLSELQVTNRTEAAALFVSVAARLGQVERVLARPAIAVLPLELADDSARARVVASGIAHELHALFARWTWFPVIALVSTEAARAQGGTVQEAGRRIGARFVVDGALHVDGESFRMLARLTDVESGSTLWTERFEFPRDALFEARDEICAAIVSTGYQVMLAKVLRPPREELPDDLAAWELAHEGMSLQAQRARAPNLRARACFGAALRREPSLVLAHYGLGLCRFDDALNQWGSRDEAADAVAACAERCIELAPHAAEGHFLLGRLWQARGDHGRVREALSSAIGRNPSFAAAHSLLGQTLMMLGDSEEGLVRIQHAVRLGPGAFVAGLAVAHFLRAEYSDAIAAAERTLAARPGYDFARVVCTCSAWFIGDEARVQHHAAVLRRNTSFDPKRFLETFGTHVDGVSRIFQALRALGFS